MSYYSHFDVSIEDRRLHGPREALADFRKGNENANCAIRDDGSAEEQAKWYEWIDDFKNLSFRNPGLLFTVRREGEESGDIEVGYFLDGEHQGGKATMTLPEFVDPGAEQRGPRAKRPDLRKEG